MVRRTQSNRFAIVLTCTQGLVENLAAAFNGIELYGNKVDVHILSKNMDPKFLAGLPCNYHITHWPDVRDPKKPVHKGGGWEVRYYRYKYALKIKEQYDALMILDADVFVCGNFMEHFEKAHKNGVLIMPDNPRGIALDRATADNVRGAASPPYHCHPHFFDPKKYSFILSDVYKYGMEEDYGDMATLYRTLYRHGIHRNVVTIPNELYCFTDWQFGKIQKSFDKSGMLRLSYRGRPMIVVHRRWANPAVREKFGNDLAPQHKENGMHNIQVFKESIDWLNETGPIKWKF
jgi:hypothetical protein